MADIRPIMVKNNCRFKTKQIKQQQIPTTQTKKKTLRLLFSKEEYNFTT